MKDERENVAVAIKSCLESLMCDAQRAGLDDLACFISLATLAAEDAAADHDARALLMTSLITNNSVGHC